MAGGTPDPWAQQLRERLAAQDVPCPGCGYNMRGVRTDANAVRCPECGAWWRAAGLPRDLRLVSEAAQYGLLMGGGVVAAWLACLSGSVSIRLAWLPATLLVAWIAALVLWRTGRPLALDERRRRWRASAILSWGVLAAGLGLPLGAVLLAILR